MFSRFGVKLHRPEEAIAPQLATVVVDTSAPSGVNAITAYFDAAEGLIKRILVPPFNSDTEVLGLLLLGVASAAELYFRSALGAAIEICERCQTHAIKLSIPHGAVRYYGTAALPIALGAIEHESLADAGRLRAELKRFTGFEVQKNSSLDIALNQFDLVCEARHAVVHTRGLLGLSGAKELSPGRRVVGQVFITVDVLLELAKITHNTVRAFNRYLFEELLFRWLSNGDLRGSWTVDRIRFSQLVNAYVKTDECDFGTDVHAAYNAVLPNIKARNGAAVSRKSTRIAKASN